MLNEMEKVKIPFKIRNDVKQYAPYVGSTESYGRRLGEYEDFIEGGAGYRAYMFYVQLGLEQYEYLIHELVNLIIEVQQGYRRRYPIVPCAFGRGREFVHEKKYFDMAYTGSKLAHREIAATIAKLSGAEKSEVPAVIPDFFSKTDWRSLYYGKTRFEQNDLMIIVGRKSEVFFDEKLKDRFRNDIKKRILFAELDGDSVSWIFRKFEPQFC